MYKLDLVGSDFIPINVNVSIPIHVSCFSVRVTHESETTGRQLSHLIGRGSSTHYHRFDISDVDT